MNTVRHADAGYKDVREWVRQGTALLSIKEANTMPVLVTEAAEQKADKIKQNLAEAIALRSYLNLWNQNNAEISEKVDGTRYANGYNVLSNAVVIGLVMSVTRIWDTGEDAISFPNLSKLINSEEFRAELSGDDYEEQRISAAKNLSGEVEMFLKSQQHYAMRVARSEGFAHNIDVSRDRRKMEHPRPVKFGELYEAIDASCRALNLAETAIIYSPTMMEALTDDYNWIFDVIIRNIPNYNENGC